MQPDIQVPRLPESTISNCSDNFRPTGYSFVYLVRDVAAAGGTSGLLPTTSDVQHLFALKRVRALAAR